MRACFVTLIIAHDLSLPPVLLLLIQSGKTPPEIYVYRLNEDGAVEEHDEEEEVTSALQWVLPTAEFDGLWETLIYDTGVKQNLLDFAATTLLFSDHGVNPDIISWNRVVLLHGPPGTGKVSRW